MPARRSLRERFEDKYTRGEPEECWIWTGSKSGTGYGNIAPPGGLGKTAKNPNAKPLSAHVVSYELYVGKIPESAVIDHSLRRGCSGNYACVNPNHLEAVTDLENVRRGRKARGKLSPMQVEQAVRLRKNGMVLRELSEKFDLSISQIHNILKREEHKVKANK